MSNAPAGGGGGANPPSALSSAWASAMNLFGSKPAANGQARGSVSSPANGTAAHNSKNSSNGKLNGIGSSGSSNSSSSFKFLSTPSRAVPGLIKKQAPNATAKPASGKNAPPAATATAAAPAASAAPANAPANARAANDNSTAAAASSTATATTPTSASTAAAAGDQRKEVESPASATGSGTTTPTGGAAAASTPARVNIKLNKLRKVLDAPNVDLDALRQISWSGVPSEVRATVWQVLNGYLPANRERQPTSRTKQRREYADYRTQYYTASVVAATDAADGIDSNAGNTTAASDDSASAATNTTATAADSTTTAAAAAADGTNPEGSITNPASSPDSASSATAAAAASSDPTPIELSSSAAARAAEVAILHQIRVDVPRTAPELKIFQSKPISLSLEKLLYVWAIRHPASGYVQGINDLATPFVVVFAEHLAGKPLHSIDFRSFTSDQLCELEADTYHCLSKLLDGIQDHYTFAQPGIQRLVFKLKELIYRIDRPLHNHIVNQKLEFNMFAYRWMNCLLMREFSLPLVIRVWDTYLSEENGDGFMVLHVYVCAALLMSFSERLIKMEFQDMVMFLQHLPTEKWGVQEIEAILAQAYVLKTQYHGSPAHLS